jgi:hypothetical protein
MEPTVVVGQSDRVCGESTEFGRGTGLRPQQEPGFSREGKEGI